jgi:predicted nucleotidyltransferase
MDINDSIPIITRYLPEVQAVYLFGSYGTEDQRSDSDVDIAVLLKPDHEALTRDMLELTGQLVDLFGRQVDVVNLRAANTVFQKEIIMSGQRVDCADQVAADEFEMLVVSAYQKLNEERQEIIEAGLAEGRFVA